MGVSKSRRSSFCPPAPRPTSVTNDSDTELSLVSSETSKVNTGYLMFNPSLDFFGQEQRTSLTNLKRPWILSWAVIFLSRVQTSLLIDHLHLFHTLQAHQHPSAHSVETTRGEGVIAAVFFGTIYILYPCGKTFHSAKLL